MARTKGTIKLKPNAILNERLIQADLDKFVRTCAETIVLEAEQLIQKFAAKEMAGYYNEYDPRIYDRTYEMYRNSYIPFHNIRGDNYEGGIQIDAFLTNHKRGKRFHGKGLTGDLDWLGRYTEEEIYDNVWIKGSHGFEQVGVRPNQHWQEITGEPDRLNRLKRKAYSDETKNYLMAKGMAKAKSQTYSILKFDRR